MQKLETYKNDLREKDWDFHAEMELLKLRNK